MKRYLIILKLIKLFLLRTNFILIKRLFLVYQFRKNLMKRKLYLNDTNNYLKPIICNLYIKTFSNNL